MSKVKCQKNLLLRNSYDEKQRLNQEVFFVLASCTIYNTEIINDFNKI